MPLLRLHHPRKRLPIDPVILINPDDTQTVLCKSCYGRAEAVFPLVSDCGVQTDSIACVGVFVLVSIWSPIAEVVIYADHREAVTMEVNCHHNRMTVAYAKPPGRTRASTAFLDTGFSVHRRSCLVASFESSLSLHRSRTQPTVSASKAESARIAAVAQGRRQVQP